MPPTSMDAVPRAMTTAPATRRQGWRVGSGPAFSHLPVARIAVVMGDGLREVEAVEVRHLDPCRHEVLYELRLRVGAAVDFGQRPQLGVGAEDQVGARGGPLQVAGLAVAAFV